MITAREVAIALGVSVSTIGRAMADDPRISAETKLKVKRMAEKLGYVGNNPARIMRGGSSKLIGLMIPDVGNDFYASIAQAMSDCVDRHDYRLVLSLTRDDRDVEARQIRELVGARAAGIILVPTPNPRKDSRSLLETIAHAQFLRRVPALGGAWFGIDDESAIRSATEHLIGLGHRRIAYIGGAASLSTGAARVGGYRAALKAAKIPIEANLECIGSPTAAFGQETLEGLIAQKNPPSALITGSVHVTAGVIEAIERIGIKIPDALSVIGFGGASWFAWWRGGLTTVCPPAPELAANCALWFLANIGLKAPALADHASAMKSTLIIRNSTMRMTGARNRFAK